MLFENMPQRLLSEGHFVYFFNNSHRDNKEAVRHRDLLNMVLSSDLNLYQSERYPYISSRKWSST